MLLVNKTLLLSSKSCVCVWSLYLHTLYKQGYVPHLCPDYTMLCNTAANSGFSLWFLTTAVSILSRESLFPNCKARQANTTETNAIVPVDQSRPSRLPDRAFLFPPNTSLFPQRSLNSYPPTNIPGYFTTDLDRCSQFLYIYLLLPFQIASSWKEMWLECSWIVVVLESFMYVISFFFL